jgi:hypothetical protein
MPARLGSHQHAVKFYADEASLFTTVGAFLSQGLVDGHPAIVIATDAHIEGIERDLDRRTINVPVALARRELVTIRAMEVLGALVHGDHVDAAAFHRVIGDRVEQTVTRHQGSAVVRAYGELVDVLWKQGRHDAALRLETLWNQLAQRCGFSLLCGYAMSSFNQETEKLEQVCAQHTHVVMPPFDMLHAGVRF